MLIPLLVLGALNAPVTEVTVYSDRARVVRQAQVTLAGAQTLELPLLPNSTDVSSVRLEASGAEVKRVDLARLDEDQLPTDEAKKVLADLQQVDDQLTEANGELAAVTTQLQSLQRLSPQLPPEDALKPPPRLSSTGWDKTVAFVADQEGKLHARSEALEQKRSELSDKRSELAEKARLLGAVRRRTGWKVTAQVAGNGPARLQLSYLVSRARWYPLYDLTLDPERSKVQVAFSGLVSQESGEDWSDAALTLSTAIPATATQVPQLFTWKIGEKERFIPTPTPMAEQLRPPPPAPPPVPGFDEVQWLRSRLVTKANSAPATLPVGEATITLQKNQIQLRQRELDYKKEESDEDRGEVGGVEGGVMGGMVAPTMPAPAEAPAPPPPPPSSRPRPQMAREDAEVMSESRSMRRESRPVPTSPFSLSPPPAYVAPTLAQNLPAMAAGGYDLAYASLQKESVATGKGARRVALFSESWPVKVERKLYPALFPEAFLVAELKSPSPQPMPAGVATLFVGADPAGTAQLKLVSPGEAFTLPLGIDRALRPKRNVKVTESEEGVFSKTEVTRYDVSIEVANPYRAPVAVRLLDQIPVTENKDVEIKLLDSKPLAAQDARTGHLEWRLTLAPQKTTTLTFSYVLKKPKGWKLRQWEVQP